MTNHSNTDSNNKEGLLEAKIETPADRESESKQGSGHLRRTGRSKREIMEELSRARFPWDE
ncbi:hypothetical protein ICN48_12080 [Polynucleobacter sp. JS-Safj-400b-B2]|jgi:hypothetical protein|uniref:hypothetical protein n=1 Tax=Polynucleobacter sp. JS-Safj-400b-B2 TaxID=2576921 RepID=UPI001C0C6F1D|nr:hypothetical protein [Polynucleobacter sp. JS-Safj-400b-B2]MBU3626967.1 hypothetical protein [Polynucleobacter sp. JS-Safj-400b-B2]